MTYVDPQAVEQQVAKTAQEAAQADPAKALGFTPLKGVTAHALRRMTFPPPMRIVEDLIPGGLTLLAGKPKIGKSFLMLELALAVAQGGSILGRPCAQGDVAYLALEDAEWRLKERLEMMEPDAPEWPERLSLFTHMESLDGDGLKQLRHWIETQPEPRLIIIDVFTKVRRIAKGNEVMTQADYHAAEPLKALADEKGVAVVAVHHLRKQRADEDPLDAVSGSTGLTGCADTIIVLDRLGASTTLYARGRDIEEIEWTVEKDGPTGRWFNKGEAREGRLTDERRKVIAALRAAGKPLTPMQLAPLTGLKLDNLKKQLLRMVKDDELTRRRRGEYGLPAWDDVPGVP